MHPLVSFLNKFNIDQNDLMKEVFPKIQIHIIDIIRPSDEQMCKWKNTVNGRKNFEDYIISKFMVFPTPLVVKVLWNNYSGKKVQTRDRKVIEKFIEVHMYCKVCEHCNTKEGKFHVDHIIPLYQGGLDDITNLQFLCIKCNLTKSKNYDLFKAII